MIDQRGAKGDNRFGCVHRTDQIGDNRTVCNSDRRSRTKPRKQSRFECVSTGRAVGRDRDESRILKAVCARDSSARLTRTRQKFLEGKKGANQQQHDGRRRVRIEMFSFILLLVCWPASFIRMEASGVQARAETLVARSSLHQHEEPDQQQDVQTTPNDSNMFGHTSNGDSDNNFTQIPFVDQKGPTTTTTTTTRKPIAAHTKRTQPSLRLMETELLPFTDFNVQQPAFSDLMRIWPPTTLQAASSVSPELSWHLQASRRQSRPQHQVRRQQKFDEFDERVLRNHLNEDLDDTIVTADQSFELDQLPEPPTWVNYLGELGDFIYLQLRLHLERSFQVGEEREAVLEQESGHNEQSSRDNESQTQTQPQQQPQLLKAESIDEILDDYYYDQYENSQVLYYGNQLVREGDIFEIGCYLPQDQAAEWTKSSHPLVKDPNSPRSIRRSDFLGAKQNFSLKIFEASPVS